MSAEEKPTEEKEPVVRPGVLTVACECVQWDEAAEYLQIFEDCFARRKNMVLCAKGSQTDITNPPTRQVCYFIPDEEAPSKEECIKAKNKQIDELKFQIKFERQMQIEVQKEMQIVLQEAEKMKTRAAEKSMEEVKQLRRRAELAELLYKEANVSIGPADVPQSSKVEEASGPSEASQESLVPVETSVTSQTTAARAGPRLSAIDEAELRRIFDMVDTDGTESIDKRELIKALRKHTEVGDFFQLPHNIRQEDGSRDAMEAFFQDADEDSNRDLTWDELKNFWAKKKGLTDGSSASEGQELKALPAPEVEDSALTFAALELKAEEASSRPDPMAESEEFPYPSAPRESEGTMQIAMPFDQAAFDKAFEEDTEAGGGLGGRTIFEEEVEQTPAQPDSEVKKAEEAPAEPELASAAVQEKVEPVAESDSAPVESAEVKAEVAPAEAAQAPPEPASAASQEKIEAVTESKSEETVAIDYAHGIAFAALQKQIEAESSEVKKKEEAPADPVPVESAEVKKEKEAPDPVPVESAEVKKEEEALADSVPVEKTVESAEVKKEEEAPAEPAPVPTESTEVKKEEEAPAEEAQVPQGLAFSALQKKVEGPGASEAASAPIESAEVKKEEEAPAEPAPVPTESAEVKKEEEAPAEEAQVPQGIAFSALQKKVEGAAESASAPTESAEVKKEEEAPAEEAQVPQGLALAALQKKVEGAATPPKADSARSGSVRSGSERSGTQVDYEVFEVTLDKTSGGKLGWSRQGEFILSIKEGGLIDDWNKRNPSLAIQVNDCLIEVNGVSIENEEKMTEELAKDQILHMKIERELASARN